MVSISEHFRQSELALASYTSLTIGTHSMDETRRDATGMSVDAAQFAESWTVIDQFTDPPSGVSATTFQQRGSGGIPSGPKYLAIRGTKPSALDLAANGLLTLGSPASLNPQFTAFQAQINDWCSDPTKHGGNSSTGTGHSLCGYLAAAVKGQYGSQATDDQQPA